MKRCHDCGNIHENEHGWCEPCHVKPSIPKKKDDGYGGIYVCTFCHDSGIPGGCVRCGQGIIEVEDS